MGLFDKKSSSGNFASKLSGAGTSFNKSAREGLGFNPDDGKWSAETAYKSHLAKPVRWEMDRHARAHGKGNLYERPGSGGSSGGSTMPSEEGLPPWLQGTGIKEDTEPQLDLSGYNKFRSWAYDPKQSDWLKTALSKEDIERGRLFDRLGMTAQSSAATGMGQLAATGGMTGGARERLQRQAGRERMMGTADVSRQSLANRLGLIGAEQQMKTQAMGRIPELDVSMYEAQMKPIAAEKLAQAIRDSQPGQSDDIFTKQHKWQESMKDKYPWAFPAERWGQ